MSEIRAAPKKGEKKTTRIQMELIGMFGFMTRNSKEGFSETWFLSANSVHFEIYDRVTSLDNPKTIINYKRHAEYIKTMVHGISLNSMCVVKGFHIRSVFSFKSPWFMIKESEIWDSETLRDILMQWNWSSIETLNTRNI